MINPSYTESAVTLLKQLISVPSFSRNENGTADILFAFLRSEGVDVQRTGNNIWARNKQFDSAKPMLLLNSHHDTVKPSNGWSTDPFTPVLQKDKLTGLGSNDAGASLVCMLHTFLHFYKVSLPFNIVFAATAEEEISGLNGIQLLLPQLGRVDFGIVGEPTSMNIAVAEKGLLVLDCTVTGRSGHAARNEGENAILKAMPDIQWFNTFKFPKTSEWLGEVLMNVTVISAGQQHNVIPDECKFTVDIRVNDSYSLEEILDIVNANVKCDVKPRSIRLIPSGISREHILYKSAKALNKSLYGSPTLSDQALMNFPTIKMGPGDSARSHTSDEYILISEIDAGIEGYIQFLNQLAACSKTNSEF